MRSAPERYGSVHAAVARLSSALGTKQQRTAKKQSNAEETQR